MLDMLYKDILPSVEEYLAVLASDLFYGEKYLSDQSGQRARAEELSNAYNSIVSLSEKLKESLKKEMRKRKEIGEAQNTMKILRELCDAVEEKLPRNKSPFPDYGDLLFSVN